jgi:uridine kinase
VIDGRFVLRERLANLWDYRIALDGEPEDAADAIAYREHDPRVVASAVVDNSDPGHPRRVAEGA